MKRMLRKKFYVALVFAVILVPFLMRAVGSFGEDVVDLERVTVFLRDVVNFDLTKYTMALSGSLSVRHREEMGGLAEVDGLYVLTSETSTIGVQFKFVNNTLARCLVDVRAGLPQFSQPVPVDADDAAREFLQRYETFTGDSSLASMISMLATVDVSKNATVASGNLTLAITVTSSSALFGWKNTYNGVGFSGLGVKFQNGIFRAFGDDRSYVQVGSTDVNVSRDNRNQHCA